MSLIQLALQNIPSSQFSELKEKFGVSDDALSSGLGVLSGAVLSAMKAGLLQNSQETGASALNAASESLPAQLAQNAFQSLFGGNKNVEGVLSEKLSSAMGVSSDGAGSFIQSAAPALAASFQALMQNLPGFLMNKPTAALAGDSENNNGVFAADGYQDALSSANQFLQSVFGKNAFSASAATETAGSASAGGGLMSGLLDMIDADNDGQVMDDIFKLLAK